MFPRHKIYYYLARFYLALRRYDEAVAAYRAALAADPRFALAASLGFLYATRSRYREAVTALREALAINQVRKIIKRVSEFDPNVTQQLIRETGQLPEGVQRR